jgi:hypothetical protein
VIWPRPASPQLAESALRAISDAVPLSTPASASWLHGAERVLGRADLQNIDVAFGIKSPFFNANRTAKSM